MVATDDPAWIDRFWRAGGNANAPERHKTVTAIDNQADSYFASGRREEAIKLKEEALRILQKANGREHPDTLIAMNKLANMYFMVGRVDEAVKLQEDVLAIMQKTDGPTHPDTLTAMEDLAGIYYVTGRNDQAIKEGEELLKLEREVVDPLHPDPVYRIAIQALAKSYEDAGRHDEAFKLRQESSAVDAKQFEATLARALRGDPNSAIAANAYAHLATAYDMLGRGEEAIKDWQEAVRIDAPGSQEAAYRLGKALVDRERYAEALPILRVTQKQFPDGDRNREGVERLALAEAMVAGQDVLIPLRQAVTDNPTDADKAMRLATVYLWLGQTNEHKAMCQKLLDLAANSDDPATQNCAAKAYLIQSHPDPEMLERAVACGRRVLGLSATNDAKRGSYLITAAMAELRDGRPADAEPLLTEATKYARFDWNRHRMAIAYRTLARADLGQTGDARIDFTELENFRPAYPIPPALSAIVLEPDVLVECMAHEEARTLLHLPPPAYKP